MPVPRSITTAALRYQISLLVICVVAFASHVPTVAADDRPNIVFILADDLGWSDLACYGHTYHSTPKLDRLAASGLRFTNAYAPAPICSASRAAILTGKTPARLNFEFVTKDNPGRQKFDVPLLSPPFTLDLPLGETTIGEALQDVGYETAFFGKWHVSQHHNGYLGWSPTHGPKQQGFPISDGDFGSHPYAYRKDKSLRNTLVVNGRFPEDTLVNQAVQFVKSEHDRPFFLYLSQYYVHDPIHTRSSKLKQKYLPQVPADQPIRASYAAMIETLDHLVGRVLDAIDEAGLSDNTLLVFTSDNGGHPNYTSNAPLRGSKWNLYEGGIRVPLIVCWPGVTQAASTTDAVAHGCDFYDTFLEAAGQTDDSSQRDGRSLVPLLKTSKPNSSDRPLVWHFPYYHPENDFDECPAEIGIADFTTSQTRPHSAIRDGQWKLLTFYEDARVELYDLSSDIGEQNDVSKEHPDIASRLRSKLTDYFTAVDARLPQQPPSDN